MNSGLPDFLAEEYWDDVATAVRQTTAAGNGAQAPTLQTIEGALARYRIELEDSGADEVIYDRDPEQVAAEVVKRLAAGSG